MPENKDNKIDLWRLREDCLRDAEHLFKKGVALIPHVNVSHVSAFLSRLDKVLKIE